MKSCEPKLRDGEVGLVGVIKDETKRAMPVSVLASISNYSVDITVAGYGAAGAAPGHGSVVAVELYDGDLRLLIWADINNETPRVISLEGASENCRDEDDEDDDDDEDEEVEDDEAASEGHRLSRKKAVPDKVYAKARHVQSFLKNIDFDLLAKQKEWLVARTAGEGTHSAEMAQGLLTLLDELQEAIIADGLMTQDEVFPTEIRNRLLADFDPDNKAGWEEVDGPETGHGVDHWFQDRDGRILYVNDDQGSVSHQLMGKAAK